MAESPPIIALLGGIVHATRQAAVAAKAERGEDLIG
jgi:hypothetical protein